MRHSIFYLGVCLLAALVPCFQIGPKLRASESASSFPGWPAQFEGRALTPLPLSERERRFTGYFPGRIARFTDGEREVVLRWVTEATRKLHPASDCFAGVGYRVQPLPLNIDEAGARWGSFTASRGDERLRVSERIYSDAGGSWSDVSAWYWDATAGNTAAPWWAVTVAEREVEQ